MIVELAILCVAYVSIICHGSVSSRSDQVGGLIKSSEKEWGSWSQDVFCNPGYFAVGFQLKVEGSQGSGDDTAANSFRMICDDGEIAIADKEGTWGGWSADMVCPYVGSASSAYITGFKTKVEGSQGWGDDTALNSVSVLCSDHSKKEAANGGSWGDWASSWSQCTTAKTSVCGFRQRVEVSADDDTSLNAVRLICCQNRRAISNPIGYWSFLAGIGNGQLSVTASKGVTHHEQSELTTEFSTSITATAELGIGFSSIGLSTTVSASLTQSTISGYSASEETSIELTCDPGSEALYQWVTKMEEDSMTGSLEFQVKSSSYFCVDDALLVPQCPFGFCDRTADANCQICDEFEKQDLGLWRLALTYQNPVGVNATDVGQTEFNNLFWHSTRHILYRYCPDCFGAWKHIYYKRYTLTDSIDLYSLTANWVSTNNTLGTDFDLYSTLEDAINDENAWTECNYNMANVGMFRGCGPYGLRSQQSTSPTNLYTKAAAFYIYQPIIPTAAPTVDSTAPIVNLAVFTTITFYMFM